MHTRSSCILSVVVLCASVTPLAAHSQLCPQAATLEYEVANADSVVVAHAISISSQNQSTFSDMTLAIDETLTGEVNAQITVSFPKKQTWHMMDTSLATVRQGIGTGAQLLLMLTRYSGKWVASASVDLSGTSLEIASAKFKILRNGKDVMRAARAEVALMNSSAGDDIHRDRVFITDCTNKAPGLQGTEFQNVQLLLPVDAELEKEARSELTGTSAPHNLERGVAIAALSHFRSEKNERLLRSFLKDPDSWVRLDAWYVLDQWGVKNVPTEKEIRAR